MKKKPSLTTAILTASSKLSVAEVMLQQEKPDITTALNLIHDAWTELEGAASLIGNVRNHLSEAEELF